MLDEQAVEGDIVAIDDQAVLVLVRVPARALAVIRAPEPEVVAHDIVAELIVTMQVASPATEPPTRQQMS